MFYTVNVQIARLLDRKLRKKKDFSVVFYNYISIIFMEKRGVCNGSNE